jgi:hypothetical protein
VPYFELTAVVVARAMAFWWGLGMSLKDILIYKIKNFKIKFEIFEI